MCEILFIFAFNCFVHDSHASQVNLIDVQKNNFLNVVIPSACFRTMKNNIHPCYAESNIISTITHCSTLNHSRSYLHFSAQVIVVRYLQNIF